jgi:hypothetical protein
MIMNKKALVFILFISIFSLASFAQQKKKQGKKFVLSCGGAIS